MVAKAAPDGYTLLWGGVAPLTVNVTLQKTPYDPIKDFAPITRIAIAPLMLVAHPSLGVKSLRELVSLAKSRPGQLNYASPGNGTTSQLSMEWLKSLAGLSIVHLPYKGTAPGMTDLLAGHVQLMFDSAAVVAPHVRAGKLTALAVTSANRIPAIPEVPTVAEAGFPGFHTEAWVGVLVPAGTPRDIISRLSNAFQKTLQSPETRDTLTQHGLEVAPTTPEQFTAFIKAEIPKWAKIIADSGTKLD